MDENERSGRRRKYRTPSKADIERMVEQSMFMDEIRTNGDRGFIIAATAIVEHEAKRTFEALIGRPPSKYTSFSRLIETLEDHRVIAESHAVLLRKLKALRNDAAHSPQLFSLKKNAKRIDEIVSTLSKHVSRLRIDPAWSWIDSDPDGGGILPDERGDMLLATLLLSRGLKEAARSLTPVSEREPVYDLLRSDPEDFCTVTLDEMQSAYEEAQDEWAAQMNAEFQAEMEAEYDADRQEY